MLRAPATHGQPFERIEHEMLDQQTNHDDRHESSKHAVGIQLVTVLEDVPAESALPGARAEHQLGRDQRASRCGEAQSVIDAGIGRWLQRRLRRVQHTAHATQSGRRAPRAGHYEIIKT